MSEKRYDNGRAAGRRRSLRTTVIGVAVLLVFFCIGITGWLSYQAGRAAVTDLMERLGVEISTRVAEDLRSFMDETADIVRYNASDTPDLRDLSALQNRSFKQLMAFEEVNAIFSGNEAQESAGVERLPDGTVVLTIASAETGFAFQTHRADQDGRSRELISEAPRFDPRTRPWYRRAVSAGAQTWTAPYPFQPRKSLYIASVCPLFGQDGRLEGAVAASLNLNRIGSFLDRLNIGRQGRIFIVDRGGDLVAASGGKAVIQEKDGRLTRLNAGETDSPLIRAAARHISERFGGPDRIRTAVQLDFGLDGERRLVQVRPYADSHGIDWLIIVVLTEADFMERITANTIQAVALGFLVLAVAVALGVWGGRWLTGPIIELSRAARRLGAGDFSERVTLARTDELGDLATGFNFMADRLQQSFAHIEQAREELEQRVAERTSVLDAQNTRLETEITERKQAEAEKEKLEAQNRQLQKAESLGRMAGAIAHHFNNQLGVVIGNMELAMMELSQGASPHAKITAAMKASNRAAEMSGLMLTYLGQSFDKREPLDLSDACRRSLPMLQAIMPGNVVLETDLPSPGPVISTTSDYIQQVLTNMVTNAWEAFGNSRGSVHLTVKTVTTAEIPAAHRFPIGWQPQDHAYACLEVTDAGGGIADEDIEKIFDPFFSSKFTGRGMGLSVVLGLVKAHDGAVTVESETGRGSAFRVFFPVSGEKVLRQPDKGNYGDALQQGVPIITSSIKTEEGGTVLLVEDEETVREVAAAILTSLGFAVLEAKDGVEAVEVFRKHQDEIRCVLCDLTMPRMNGWETLTALRKLVPDVPVILASGYDKAQVMAGDHPELPQVFLGKPYKLKGLSDAIGQALVNKKK